MSFLHLEWNPVDQQLESLRALVEELRREVGGLRAENVALRRENAELRQQVSSLKCDVGYWKSRHADAVERNTKRQAELDKAKAEIRRLKDERFGKKTEKQSASDRTNRLDDPTEQTAPKKNRGRQPGSPAPKRRDYSHLPAQIREVDVPDDAKACACCGLPLEGLGQHEDSEQIEIETVTYRRVVRRKRYRRTCKCTDQPQTVTAALPPKLLPKSIYGTSVWVHLLLEKDRALAWLLRIRELYCLNRERLRHSPGTSEQLLPNPLCSNMWPPWLLSEIPNWRSRNCVNHAVKRWLTWYFEAYANSGGKAPDDVAEFLPWNLSPDRLAELQDSTFGKSNVNSS